MTETHETVCQPASGLWMVTQADRELVTTRNGEYWKTHRTWTGSIESNVEDSRETIHTLREVYDELVQRRAVDEARHARDLTRCERIAASALRGVKALANPADPFAALRSEA